MDGGFTSFQRVRSTTAANYYGAEGTHYGNQLVGSIPSTLGNLGRLSLLNMHRNMLTGAWGADSRAPHRALFLTPPAPHPVPPRAHPQAPFRGSWDDCRRCRTWTCQATTSAVPSLRFCSLCRTCASCSWTTCVWYACLRLPRRGRANAPGMPWLLGNAMFVTFVTWGISGWHRTVFHRGRAVIGGVRSGGQHDGGPAAQTPSAQVRSLSLSLSLSATGRVGFAYHLMCAVIPSAAHADATRATCGMLMTVVWCVSHKG